MGFFVSFFLFALFSWVWTTVSDTACLSLWLFQKPVKALPVSGLYCLVFFMWRRAVNKVLHISLLLPGIFLFLGIAYSAFLFFLFSVSLVTSFSSWLLCEKAHLFWTLLFSPFLCGDLITVTNLSLSAQITFKSLSSSCNVTPPKKNEMNLPSSPHCIPHMLLDPRLFIHMVSRKSWFCYVHSSL